MKRSLAVLAALLVIPMALAHLPNDPDAGYVRVVGDCEDDYGLHAGNPSEQGHDLVVLDVTEKEVEGEMLVVLQVTVSLNDEGTPKRETFRFDTPRDTIRTRILTEDESTYTFNGYDQPVYISDSFEALLPPNGEGGSDAQRQRYEFGYTYAQLQVAAGETLGDFHVSGQVRPLSAWIDGDVMPQACEAGDHLHADADYTVLHSNWTPPSGNAPTVTVAGPDRREGPGTVSLTATGDDPDGGPVAYAWSTTGGILDASGDQATVTFDEVGLYQAQVTATDEEGLTATTVHDITVDDRLAVALTFANRDGRQGGTSLYDGLTKAPVVQVDASYAGIADTPAATVAGTAEVVYRLGAFEQVLATLDVAGTGTFDVELPFDIAALNLPGTHEVRFDLSADSHPDAPVQDAEAATATGKYTVRPVGLGGPL